MQPPPERVIGLLVRPKHEVDDPGRQRGMRYSSAGLGELGPVGVSEGRPLSERRPSVKPR